MHAHRNNYFDLVWTRINRLLGTRPNEKSYTPKSHTSKKDLTGSKHAFAFLIDLQVRNPSDESSLLNSLYIYRELLRRNMKATWVRLNPPGREWSTKIKPV